MAYVDTRKFGSNRGGRVSVHAPSSEDLDENPYACARTYAMNPQELAEHKKQMEREDPPRPSRAKRFLAG